MPTAQPTISPVFAPSDLPSTNAITSVKRECEQYLEVNASEKFTEEQVEIYELLMQSYTANFDAMVSSPQIDTVCEVTGQVLVEGKNLIVMSFTMQYESRWYDVEDYPHQFLTFINSNLAQVTEDMDRLFLPVVEAQEMIMYMNEPMDNPSASPTIASQLEELPSSFSSLQPSESRVPTFYPSVSPVSPVVTTVPIYGEGDTSAIVVFAVGLGGATIMFLLVPWYMRRKNQKKENDEVANRRSDLVTIRGELIMVEEGLAFGDGAAETSSRSGVASGEIMHRNSHHSGQYENYHKDSADSIIILNSSMVSEVGSLSSDPEDQHQNVAVNALQREFHSYENHVDKPVYDAKEMRILAMARALMEDEDVGADLSWSRGGAEDPESIEANCLCETNDWLRKHDKSDESSVEKRNIFFQELLDKMVVTVRQGMMSPSDGTRAIHGCAAMLGLQLEKELPDNVVLVHGMRKANDLSSGRSHLVKTFQVFGYIEGASIASNNKGFGFVRFVSPKSVQRALERFRISEIEVQDVSVMIKSLKSGGKAV